MGFAGDGEILGGAGRREELCAMLGKRQEEGKRLPALPPLAAHCLAHDLRH